MLVTSTNGRIIECNQSCTRLIERAAPNLSLNEITDLVSPDDQPSFLGRLEHTVSSGQANKFLIRFPSMSGTLWLLWSVNFDVESGLMYWIGQDVTEFKRSAASLEILEEVTGTGVWELDKYTNTAYWSRKTHEIHETYQESFSPGIDDALAFFPDAAREQLIAALAELDTDGTPYNLQLPFTTAKGNDIIVNARGYAQRREGQTIRMYGTFKDVTEDVARHEEERKLHKRMSLALEFSQIGVWEFQVKERSLVWDERMFAMYDVLPDHFSGHLNDWQKSVHEDDLEETMKAFIKTLHTGSPFSRQFRIRTDNDETRHIKALASAVYDDNGKISHIIGVNLDITEEVNKSNQYQQAKEAAEAANKAQASFLALMSHEIRTPLNGLIGSLQVLENTPLPDNGSRFVQQSILSARTLVAIINDILDYSKVSANKMTLEELPVDIENVAQQVIDEHSALAESKKIQLELEVPEGMDTTYQLDPLRIKQVMTNLISNAIKFTPQGKVKVSIRNQPDTELTISIQDTGIGMNQEQMDNLFSPFTQADSATTREYGGTGLGLSIVSSFIKLMDGTVSVDSQEGVGSCFTVTLPRTPISGRAAAQPQVKETEIPAPDLSHRRIIVAEDNEINQMVVEAFMHECKVNAHFVENGQALVDAFSISHYDIVLCDIRMPVMNGIEACKQIRENYPEIPIIAFTANVMQDDIVSYRDAGFTDVISKPVERNKLFEQLALYV